MTAATTAATTTTTARIEGHDVDVEVEVGADQEVAIVVRVDGQPVGEPIPCPADPSPDEAEAFSERLADVICAGIAAASGGGR